MEWLGTIIGFVVLGVIGALFFYILATITIRISKLRNSKDRSAPAQSAKSKATTLKRPSASNARQAAAFRWVPFGESVSVSNADIAGGGFYLGDHTRPNSPAVPLVDPALRVDFKQQEWSAELGYWPEYERLTPRQRGTLLAYLNSKRESSQVAIGYVFLYYYGLERRIFVDAFHDESLAGELPQLVAEVQRLHRVYGPLNHSFKQYSGRVATLGPLLHDSPVPLQPYDSFPWDMSEEMAASLGQAVKAGRGLTAEEAMLWASTLTNASKGKAYSKVMPEIRTLFESRYREQYPAGLGVPLPKTKLKFDIMLSAPGYRSAEFATDLPDVRRVSAPLKPVVAMLEGVLKDIHPLLLLRGREETPSPISLLAVMPPGLAPAEEAPIVTRLRQRLTAAVGDKGVGAINLGELTNGLELGDGKKLVKKEATVLVQGLEALGFGIEPDVRFLGANPAMSTKAVVYRQTYEPSESPSPAYAGARLMVQASTLIAGADDKVSDDELQSALEAVEKHFALPDSERERLQAHAEFLRLNPESKRRIENQVKKLPEAERSRFARVMLDIAVADGHVSPAEVLLLERFYELLELDPQRVHVDIHSASLGDHPAANGKADAGAIDAESVARKLADTAKVQTLLGDIFDDEEPSAPAAPAEEEAGFSGLDTAHTALLRRILAETAGEDVSRAILDELCEALDLLPDGAFEAVNEVAFEHAGEALLEPDGDQVYVSDYVRGVLAEQLATAA